MKFGRNVISLAAFAAMGLSVASFGGRAQAAQDMSLGGPQKAVEALFTAMTSETPSAAALAATLTDDAVVSFSDTDTPAVGKEQVMKKLQGLYAPGMTYKVNIHSVYSEGRVVVVTRDDISVKNGQVSPNGFYVVGVFTVTNGKVSGWRDFARNERAPK